MLNVKDKVKDVTRKAVHAVKSHSKEARSKLTSTYKKVLHNDKVDCALEFVSEVGKAYLTLLFIAFVCSVFSYELVLLASVVLLVGSFV